MSPLFKEEVRKSPTRQQTKLTLITPAISKMQRKGSKLDLTDIPDLQNNSIRNNRKAQSMRVTLEPIVSPTMIEYQKA
jgi:hypothetical protein